MSYMKEEVSFRPTELVARIGDGTVTGDAARVAAFYIKTAFEDAPLLLSEDGFFDVKHYTIDEIIETAKEIMAAPEAAAILEEEINRQKASGEGMHTVILTDGDI